ncbi:MAG: hypothetical protein OXC40_04770 [Proteobacteria bacterium]|nr:hypothetical protein [Pseudomonadota bacterium]
MDKTHHIRLALSSDSDDAVMVFALQNQLIDLQGYSFEVVSDDIENLNQIAQQAASKHVKGFHISAISAATFPLVSHAFDLLPVGASFGFSWGPSIVVAQESPAQSIKDLAGLRLAIPGAHTSAYATAQMVIGDFQPVFIEFQHIAKAVISKKVDGGILIHEAQLITPPGLRNLGYLTKYWHEVTQTSYPLPLGVIVCDNSLSDKDKQSLTQIYRNSIQYGIDHIEDVLPQVLASLKLPYSYRDSKIYITRYVEASALNYSPAMRQGLQLWLDYGANRNLWPSCSGDLLDFNHETFCLSL